MKNQMTLSEKICNIMHKFSEFIDAIKALTKEEHQFLIKLLEKSLAEEELSKSYEEWKNSRKRILYAYDTANRNGARA